MRLYFLILCNVLIFFICEHYDKHQSDFFFQLSFKAGDSLKIIQKCSEHWYWAELNGIVGYAPVNHLAPNHPTLHQICWQDDEYFESYGKLVILIIISFFLWMNLFPFYFFCKHIDRWKIPAVFVQRILSCFYESQKMLDWC